VTISETMKTPMIQYAFCRQKFTLQISLQVHIIIYIYIKGKYICLAIIYIKLSVKATKL